MGDTQRITGVYGTAALPPPWTGEIEYKLLNIDDLAPVPPVSETAFFHCDTKTLLVTDSLIKVPSSAPLVLESYGNDGTPGQVSPELWRLKVIYSLGLEPRGSDAEDFEALTRAPVLVPPIIRYAGGDLYPKRIAAWVQDVAKWPFERVVSAHFEAPITCGPAEYLGAYNFLFGKAGAWDPEEGQLGPIRFFQTPVVELLKAILPPDKLEQR